MTEQSTLEELRIFSGLTIKDIDEVFFSLSVLAAINHCEDTSITIPGLGEMKTHYKGSLATKIGKDPQVSVEFFPSPSFIRVIKQIEDAKNHGDFENIDLFTKLKKKINYILQNKG